jgi:hypothetical protein
MARISTPLGDYLASLAKKRWQPGVLDCGVFMADWVVRMTGRDPIADVRGTYSTREEYEAILDREGGFLKSSARRLRAMGFSRVKAAREGDIVVVASPSIEEGREVRKPTGAIAVSETQRAVITSDLGIVIAGEPGLPMLRVWRFHA